MLDRGLVSLVRYSTLDLACMWVHQVDALKEGCGDILFDIMASSAPAILWEVATNYALDKTRNRLMTHMRINFDVRTLP
jgi:hypothetical protein